MPGVLLRPSVPGCLRTVLQSWLERVDRTKHKTLLQEAFLWSTKAEHPGSCCKGYTEEDPLIHVFLIMALWTSGSRQTATEVRRAAYSGGNIRGIIRAGSGESARYGWGGLGLTPTSGGWAAGGVRRWAGRLWYTVFDAPLCSCQTCRLRWSAYKVGWRSCSSNLCLAWETNPYSMAFSSPHGMPGRICFKLRY